MLLFINCITKLHVVNPLYNGCYGKAVRTEKQGLLAFVTVKIMDEKNQYLTLGPIKIDKMLGNEGINVFAQLIEHLFNLCLSFYIYC